MTSYTPLARCLAFVLSLAILHPGGLLAQVNVTTPSGSGGGAGGATTIGLNNDVPLTFGTSAVAGCEYDTQQTPDAMLCGVDQASRVWWFHEQTDAVDYGLAQQVDPTICVHSSAATANQYGCISHDQSNMLFNAGTGAYQFGTATGGPRLSGVASFAAIDSAGSGLGEIFGINSTYHAASIPAGHKLINTGIYGWSLDNSVLSAFDTGWARKSAGVAQLTNGSTSIRGLMGGGAAIASAAALPVPTGGVMHVTGTNVITSITSTNFAAGVCITLIFDGITTLTDGSNLVMAGNLVTTADDTWSGCYDGTSWFETARSVN